MNNLGERAGALREYLDAADSFLKRLEKEKKDLPLYPELSPEELSRRNRGLYEEIFPENYERSFLNPSYAVRRLGGKTGQILSAVYSELRSGIIFAFAGEEEPLLRRRSLYEGTARLVRERMEKDFAAAAEPCREECDAGFQGQLIELFRKYVLDSAESFDRLEISHSLTASGSVPGQILREADLSDIRYLYRFGLYVGENSLGTARFLNGLPQEDIARMADTFSEGYRIGFEVTGKDLSRKRYCSLISHLGFERMMRRAADNFEKMGLRTVTPLHNPCLLFIGRNGGTVGDDPNPQYEYDHREDAALLLDEEFVNSRLEARKKAFEALDGQTQLYAGPAVLETFGDPPFEPGESPGRVTFSPDQQSLAASMRSRASVMYNEAVIGSERSFTIISFPVPSIGENFGEIFRAVMDINTLDYRLYRDIQQIIIDALDIADRVVIRGRGGNRTDLTVALQPRRDPAHQTAFENCVADVNIPVGEVFTSPQLRGTNGLLHVSSVYLEGLEFRDLAIRVENGRVTDYSCGNFPDGEQGRALIEESILFHHRNIAMGEFAIGTNTTAYAAGRKYGICDRLPILIAEKTGPHFAFGDTCYSYEEDNHTFNPDGKEHIAKENEISAQRKTDPEKAYYGCHTDITMPFEEIGSITAVRGEGSTADRVTIIENGRFVLPGTEELNIPLESRKEH